MEYRPEERLELTIERPRCTCRWMTPEGEPMVLRASSPLGGPARNPPLDKLLNVRRVTNTFCIWHGRRAQR